MNLRLVFAATIAAVFMLPGPGVSGNKKAPLPATAPFESVGDGPIHYVDYSNFQGIDSQTYVEFYIQVGYNDLQFIKKDRQFEAGYELAFAVLADKGDTLESHKIRDIFQVNTFDETVNKKKARVSLMAFSFAPGRYKLRTTLTDVETNKATDVEQFFEARNLDKDSLMVSDVQLSQNIKPAEAGQAYVKNKRYIEPNPIRTFGHGMHDICLYFEVYNLMSGCEDNYTNYVSHFIIHNEEGRKYAHVKRLHPKPGNTSAHSIRFPVDHFLQGKYKLTLKIVCEDTGREVETTTAFTVFDSPVAISTLDYHEFYK